MKKFMLILAVLVSPSLALAAVEERSVEPRIDSVGLFKNGLVVVNASFAVDGPGTYRWDHVPHVTHGSFWIESDGVVSVLSTRRKVSVKDATDAPTGRIHHDLTGRNVTVTPKAQFGTSTLIISAETTPIITGRVLDIPGPAGGAGWDTNYSSLNPQVYPSWHRAMPVTPSAPGFLVLEENGRRRYIDISSVAMVEAAGPFDPVERLVERPVLVFQVADTPGDGARIHVSWLAKGMAWMPSYRIDLSDPARLVIRQGAVVRNEFSDLADTEIRLISGFPNVGFGAVDSPLVPASTLAAFFQQISGTGSARFAAGSPLSQQLVLFNQAAPEAPAFAPDIAEQEHAGDDIHYESIGQHTLAAGDSLSLDVAAETADYRRVVEWQVPDDRDGDGRYRGNDREERDDAPWDAVRFANPFAFPMTTAPALVTESGKFRGQSVSAWANPGQRASVRITRALSVTTEAAEVEDEQARELIHIGGVRHRATTVTGTLKVKNHRGSVVTMSVRREFSGKLLEADGEPEASLRAGGVTSVNERRRLEWTFDLPAGDEREITYRYRVLVRD